MMLLPMAQVLYSMIFLAEIKASMSYIVRIKQG
jgi:hypothetical protein